MASPSRYEERSWSDEPARIYVATAELPDTPPLPAAEVATLRDGERVIVYWGGGNGPHAYEIEREEDGTLWALSRPEDRGNHTWKDPMVPSYLTSYGTQRWQSKVWVAEGDVT